MLHGAPQLLAFLLFFIPQSPALDAKAAGVAAAQQGHYSEAAKQFGEACRLDSLLKDACYYQGRALYYSNRFKEAIPPLEKSIAVGESAARAHSTIAECYEALGDAAQAETAHRKAIAGSLDPEFRVRFAVFLFRQGRAAEAVSPLQEALKKDPANFEANRELGRILFEQENFAGALVFLDKAIAVRPRDTEAQLLAGKVCQRLGRTAEAAAHLKAAQTPEP